MNEHPAQNPDATSSEELVAYLDGELNAADRQRIEERLAVDAEYRSQLGALQESWDWLDMLPRATTDHQLTQTTIAMVAQREQEESRGRRSRAARTFRPFPRPWVYIVAAAMIGFVVLSLPLRALRNRNLRDLPIANNLELYRYAEDIEFLELLHSDGIFAEEETNDL